MFNNIGSLTYNLKLIEYNKVCTTLRYSITLILE